MFVGVLLRPAGKREQVRILLAHLGDVLPAGYLWRSHLPVRVKALVEALRARLNPDRTV